MTDAAPTPNENALMLNKTLGGTWSYRSGRDLFESQPMDQNIALDISAWLAGIAKVNVHEGRSGFGIPDGKMVLSIGADQPLQNIEARRHTRSETLHDLFARQRGMDVTTSQIGV